MSKKRTSDESNNDEQTLFQNQDNAKRANFDSNSDTTLQDLPMELLECILVKVVATEVMDLRLVKSVWKEKADLVIGRLGSVCSQWSHILSTNFFRTKLNRILDGTAQKSIGFEVLIEVQTLHPEIFAVTTMNDEIFMLYKPRDQNCTIYVYDRNNLAVVKNAIPLPGRLPVCMVACNVSNCVYVGLRKQISPCLSVLRISKDAEHQFNISPWMEDHRLCIYAISVSANGSLLMVSERHHWEPHVVSEYDANGFLQQEIRFTQDADTISYRNLSKRSNGNFILAYAIKKHSRLMLKEIDSSGSVVRQYQSVTLLCFEDEESNFVSFVDILGAIVIGESYGEIEILDFEFNLKHNYDLLQDAGRHTFVYDLHYDSKRNEILRINNDWGTGITVLTIYRFTEE